METIKKKINALKEDNEIKQDEIERLQEPLLIPSPLCPPIGIRDGSSYRLSTSERVEWTNLKAQLKKEEEEREKCEQELASMDNKIKLLEESLDKAEENLSQTTTKLNDIETVSERSNRVTKKNCSSFRVPGVFWSL